MYNPFSPERFGRPQVYAILLLLAFFAQTVWIVAAQPLRPTELAYIEAGVEEIKFHEPPPTSILSPIVSLVSAAPVLVFEPPFESAAEHEALRWPARLPFVVLGLLLGGSIWYVARRLYGNLGGYIALTLYCFSAFTGYSARVSGFVVGAFGIFGVIFVAIAVSHTLYAFSPDTEGRPWAQVLELRHRWRRILLLAAALVLSSAAGFAAVVAVALALAFMLYLAPGRRIAATTILILSCAIAFLVLLPLTLFHPRAIATALAPPAGVAYYVHYFGAQLAFYFRGLLHLARDPGLLLLSLASLAAYIAWRRSRYFGNTAPLLVLIALWFVGVLQFAPDLLSYGAFPLRGLSFLFVFIAGLCADMLETRHRLLVAAVLTGLLASHAVLNLLTLSNPAFPGH
jgi:hypothetical protein